MTSPTQSSAEKELLPCPFCGNAGTVNEIEADCFGVGCEHCDFNLMTGPFPLGWFRTQADAIAAWNRRSAPASGCKAVPEELIAAGALRQLRHNDGTPGFVFAYDKDVTDRFIGHIVSQRVRAALKEASETDKPSATSQPEKKQ